LIRRPTWKTGGRFAETAAEPVTHAYDLVDGELVDTYDGSGHLPSENAVSALRGAGAMVSTAPDLARWMYLLCRGQVLSPESQAQMLDLDTVDGYGLGVVGVFLGSVGQVIGRGGGTTGYSSAAYCDQDTGAVLAVLTTGEFRDPIQLLD
jgi:CubicO group peptidase (beta-lactamase class C family)